MSNKKIKQLLSASVILLVSYFFINRLSASWNELSKEITFTPSVWSLLAVLFFCAAVVVSGLLWGRVLGELTYEKGGNNIRKIEMARVHAAAWLLKYIPGQVGALLFKLNWGKKHDYKKRTITLSFIYENLFLTIVSILPTSLILLLQGSQNTATNLVLGLLVTTGLLLVFSKRLLIIFFRLLAKKTKFSVSDNELIENKRVAVFSSLYAVPRIINGIGFVFVAVSLFSIDVSIVLPLIAAYTLAGIIGIYAIFVPSGLGVREAMIVILAGGIIGVDQAILLAVVTRFYATIADGVLASFYATLTHASNKRTV